MDREEGPGAGNSMLPCIKERKAGEIPSKKRRIVVMTVLTFFALFAFVVIICMCMFVFTLGFPFSDCTRSDGV